MVVLPFLKKQRYSDYYRRSGAQQIHVVDFKRQEKMLRARETKSERENMNLDGSHYLYQIS